MALLQHKLLRILSGRHAGGSLQLEAGEHTIGADNDNDIIITDWTAPTLVVKVSADVAANDRVEGLSELQPVRFGDVVVCIGPAEGAWPTDLELLARLFEPSGLPPIQTTDTRRPRKTTIYGLCGGVAAISVFCLVAVMVQARPQLSAPATSSPLAASQRVRQALERAGVRGLQVSNDASTVSIDGMVETRVQSQLAFNAISELSLGIDLRPRFAVVEDVVESIRSSVGLPQAEITHLGGGVFSLKAESVDPDSTRAAVGRVAADLAPSVQRIELAVTQLKAARRNTNITSSFSDGDVSIVQTKNGAKYFGLTQPETHTEIQAEPAATPKN